MFVSIYLSLGDEIKFITKNNTDENTAFIYTIKHHINVTCGNFISNLIEFVDTSGFAWLIGFFFIAL